MNRLKALIDRKFLKDRELLELEDNDLVIGCKYLKPYNAHYNEYIITILDCIINCNTKKILITINL